MLFSFCELRENWCSEGLTFLIKNDTHASAVKPYVIFQVKKALIKKNR